MTATNTATVQTGGSRLRVLIINTLYPPNLYGGAEKSVELLARGLTSDGHEVTVLSLGFSGTPTRQLSQGIRATFLPLRNVHNPWKPGGPHSAIRKIAWHTIDLANPAMAWAVRANLAEIRPDIVHTNNLSGFSTLVWSEARRAGVPVAHTLRDYWLLCPLATMFRNEHRCVGICFRCRLASAVRRRHSAVPLGVAGVSQHILDVHKAAGYFPGAAIQQRIINPVAEPGVGFVPRARSGAQPVRLGYMGAIHPTKGISRLIDALRIIGSGGWQLFVAGRGDQAYVTELRQRAAALPVEFMGFVDADTFYSTVDVVIIPSIWDDPMPRIVLESFSRGLPVIASRRGGIGELVAHGRNGYLFDPERQGELEAAIRLALADAGSLPKLGSRGRARVTALSLTEVATTYADFYRAILRRHRRITEGRNYVMQLPKQPDSAPSELGPA